MEDGWSTLFDVFLNSPCPDGEASVWMTTTRMMKQQQQQQTKPPISSANFFLSLLLKPIYAQATPVDSESNTINTGSRDRCLWIQTLPIPVQSRLLSFLAINRHSFSSTDLRSLAIHILNQHQPPPHLFWVRNAARQLLDAINDCSIATPHVLSPSHQSDFIPRHRHKEEEGEEYEHNDEFYALPEWLHGTSSSGDSVLSWLPISSQELRPNINVIDGHSFPHGTTNASSIIEVDGDDNYVNEELAEKVDFLPPPPAAAMENEPRCADTDTLEPEIHIQASALKAQLKTFNSASETVSLANQICHLCFDEGGIGNGITILGLIEPWETNDETTSILLSHLPGRSQDDFVWSSWVLSSVVLPKMLLLLEPASRVLVSSTVEYCKLHQRAAVDALLLPSVLRKEGINTPLCDFLSRIVRECLHPAHVSSFCQKLLCNNEATWRFVCLPCHQCLISHELVWTDALFTLFQNILNCDVYLTQDSLNHIVSVLDKLAPSFSKSLKFGNFLLCLVSKYASSLKVHRLLLVKVAKRTDTFMTKAILSKLAFWFLRNSDPKSSWI